ncbi:MAG: translation elongation factor Ts [Spirochaetales bacterium]
MKENNVDIKATDVKKLREKTGAGMMDCKKALTEAAGDFAKAEKILKELGLAAAAKRGGRATNEGRVFTHVGTGTAGILEVSCETDFVARNQDFVALGERIVAGMVESGKPATDPAYAELVQEAITTIKENMAIRRGELIEVSENEFVSDYIHGESGRIGVLAKIKVDKPELLSNEAVKSFAFDVALHVAAFRPTFLSVDTADPSYVSEQEEIFNAQAKALGKPENVTKGIAAGKLKKHLAEICLVDQGFVKDEKRSVAQVAKDLGKEVGGNVEVAGFVYYMVGEEV